MIEKLKLYFTVKQTSRINDHNSGAYPLAERSTAL